MADAPSQLDLFDYKPKLDEFFDKDLPDSIRQGQRITTMTSGQARLAVAPSLFKFAQHGQAGAWISELLPNIASIVDDLTIVKTVNTEAINHDPAITYIQTGSQIPGRPSAGAWLSYGLGCANKDPAGLCRAALASRSRLVVAGPVLEAVGFGLAADQAPGRLPAVDRRSGAVPVEPAGGLPTAGGARCSTG